MPQKIDLYVDNRLYDHPTRILLTHKQRRYDIKTVRDISLPEEYVEDRAEPNSPIYFERGDTPFVSSAILETEAYVDARFAGSHVLPNDVQSRYRMLFATKGFVNTVYPLLGDIAGNSGAIVGALGNVLRYMDENGHIWNKELTYFDVFLIPVMWRLREKHTAFKSKTHPFARFAANYFTLDSVQSTVEAADE